MQCVLHSCCMHSLTREAQSNSGVTAVLTPVSTMLLFKQTSQPESDLLRQAIPLSAPGTPHCLMPVGTTVPGPSACDWGSDTLLVPPFATWISNNTTQLAPSSNRGRKRKEKICWCARCLKIRLSAPTSCPGCENIVFLCSCTFILNLHNLSSSLEGGSS